ncbi:cellulase family glycosylhydrolase [Halomicrobium salinisoli]|uniref:cellulase family glycosylhydrolase n=1 Tax=Halomicrobium salinisoli TaxID=2878391 RepID=UPI001CF06C71|nr:cellulase family glycosylhydrolase [Halomicrobium salinisoli]
MTRNDERGDANERSTGSVGAGAATRRSLLKTVGAAATVAGVGAAGTAVGEVPTPRLHTDGRWIKDPSGNNVKLRGVAMADPGFYGRSWHPKSAEEVAKLATDADEGWHPNHVRIPCSQSSVDHHGGVETYVEDYLRPIVDLLETQGVYALVDFHLIRPYTAEATETYNQENDESYGMPDDVVPNFWETVAPEFAEDEHVIYELFNEPTRPGHYGDDEAAWSAWKEAAQPWVDLVQEHAPATPLVIGSPRWTSVPHIAPQDPFEGDNLIYAGHIYPDNGYPESEGPDGSGPFDPTYGEPANDVPIWITEFGWDPEGGNIDKGENSGFGTRFREWVESYENMSWTAWCFDDTWAPTMFSSPTQDASTPWSLKDGEEQHGGFIKEWLAERRDDMIPENPVDDGQAPPTPTGLAVDDATEISVAVSWTGVEDRGEAGLSHYRLLVEGEEVRRVAAGTTEATVSDLSPGSSYEVGVAAVDDAGNESSVATTNAQTLGRSEGQSAYREHTVPARIRAEHFDEGGQGIAYYDSSESDQAAGDFRDAAVDIGTSDEDGYNVGYVTAGEWLEYTVVADEAGEYELRVQWASGASSGGTVAVEVDGERVASQTLWNTGGWSNWDDTRLGSVSLSQGTHVVRVVAESSGWNFDWLQIGDPGDQVPNTGPADPGDLTVEIGDDGTTAILDWTVGGDSTQTVDHFVVSVGDRSVETTETTATFEDLLSGTDYEASVVVVGNGGAESDPATMTFQTPVIDPTPEPEPIDGTRPTDPDGDGLYEDLNGNGEIDYADVVEYFDNMDGETMQADARFYDYNGNGEVDFADLVDLFKQV